jgi:hypothetical protein
MIRYIRKEPGTMGRFFLLALLLAAGSANCEAYNYLGLVYMRKDGNRAAQYFLGMCSCVDSAIESTRRNIAFLPRLDPEPAELNQMKARLSEGLSDYRKSSADMIENALTMMDLIKIKERDLYRKLMEKTLLRIAAEPQ